MVTRIHGLCSFVLCGRRCLHGYYTAFSVPYSMGDKEIVMKSNDCMCVCVCVLINIRSSGLNSQLGQR
jgi:hypothetical protein